MTSLAELGEVAKRLPSSLRGVSPENAGMADALIRRHQAGRLASEKIALKRRQPSIDRSIAEGRKQKALHQELDRGDYGPGMTTQMRVQRQKDLGMPYPKEHEGSWWLR